MPKAKYRTKRHEVTQPSDPSYRIIPLTKGQNALVDTEDYERVNRWNWVAHWAKCINSFYADREESGKTISMQNFIMGPPEGKSVDHINGDSLDNRKHNLRVCTQSQNAKNKKRKPGRYLGIYWRKDIKKWHGEVMSDGKRVFVGHFDSAEDCARARDAIAIKLHGDFANLNFPLTN